ncbi:MAG: hypothetical protein EA423_03465 [Phycisphaerales bacterium]|nr:MAG: hypothetical protein EA423_03465 [Phycisphaerales bacterium]
MSVRILSASRFLVAAALAASSSAASAQVVVGDGQTLTRADLLAGVFNGLPFTLGPNLVIDINAGGAMGNLSNPGWPPSFDLAGATVNVNRGGTIQSGPGFGGSHYSGNSTLNIFDGAAVGAAFVQGLTSPSLVSMPNMTMYGGEVGDDMRMFGGTFVMLGGSIGDGAGTDGTTFTMTGGTIGDRFTTGTGFFLQPFAISGGIIGDELRITGWGTISGGVVGADLMVDRLARLSISGGAFGSGIHVPAYDTGEGIVGGTLNLLVTALLIDGTPITLTPGETLQVSQRGGALLEATLADGSPFEIVLNDTRIQGQDHISSHARLTVMLVPAPNAAALLVFGGILAARRRRCS